MIWIRRMLVWLGRISHCRGFGVQSPWAYRMVRYVINEHYPYYAYGRLDREYPHLDAVTRKICRLCLRLANEVRPRQALLCCVDGDVFSAYLKAGCRSVECKDITYEGCDCASFNPLFALFAPHAGLYDAFTRAVDVAADGSTLLLIGIHGDKTARKLWREVTRGIDGVVTFDLYYCGLVFFDPKRYKQNYIINF